MDNGLAKPAAPQRSSGGCVILAIVLCVGLMVGFVIIAGAVGAWVYFRSAQRDMVERQERDLAEALRARVEAEMAGLDRKTEIQVSPSGEPGDVPPTKALELRIDAEGVCNIQGKSFDAGTLKSYLLGEATEDGLLRISVRADRRCPFDRVAKVLAVCREAGVEIGDVRALDEP